MVVSLDRVSSPLAGSSPAALRPRDYYSVAQAADVLGVSQGSIRRWIRAGHLPAFRVGPRTMRIRRTDLERLVAERQIDTACPGEPHGSMGRVAVDGEAFASRPDPRAMGASDHFVQFYETDEALVAAVSGYIAAALRSGDVAIVVATAAHRQGIERQVRAEGVDVAAARDSGHYVVLDAAAVLASFMVGGRPDPERFAQTMDGIIAPVTARGYRLRVFGEMVALLALDGNHAAAVRLEELWNDLQRRHPFALYCAYPMSCLHGASHMETLGEVCGRHTRVIPPESYTELPTADDRLRAVIAWQQKAQALEAALAAELAAREAAEEALRARDEFLSIASHELRTPLTTLLGRSQMMLRSLERDGDLDPEGLARSLETIRDHARKLSRLITQLLDVSRLQAGKLALERVPTNLTHLAEQAVAAMRVMSGEHTIIVSAPPALEALVDPLRLEQVLLNVLDNAVKYSPDGGPIEVVLGDGGAGTIELSVRDRGLGVPAEKRERLFERFYQAHPEGQRGGMGLGLYISRQIVGLHGGRISAEFPADGGTRVVVRLPRIDTA